MLVRRTTEKELLYYNLYNYIYIYIFLFLSFSVVLLTSTRAFQLEAMSYSVSASTESRSQPSRARYECLEKHYIGDPRLDATIAMLSALEQRGD